MIRELAEYEKALHEARASEEQLREALFGERPAAFAHIAETADGEVVGLRALVPQLLDVARGARHLSGGPVRRPGPRGGGYGKALLSGAGADLCGARYERLEWSVLNWNTPSIDFYESLGAQPQDEWTVYRLTDEALTRLGSSGEGGLCGRALCTRAQHHLAHRAALLQSAVGGRPSASGKRITPG